MKKPSLTKMVVDFGKAVVSHVSGGLETLDPIDYVDRLKICNSCQMFNGVRCLKCGCFVKIKARWKVQNCPLNRWPQPPK